LKVPKAVPEDMLRRAATMGICKINIDTDLRLAYDRLHQTTLCGESR